MFTLLLFKDYESWSWRNWYVVVFASIILDLLSTYYAIYLGDINWIKESNYLVSTHGEYSGYAFVLFINHLLLAVVFLVFGSMLGKKVKIVSIPTYLICSAHFFGAFANNVVVGSVALFGVG